MRHLSIEELKAENEMLLNFIERVQSGEYELPKDEYTELLGGNYQVVKLVKGRRTGIGKCDKINRAKHTRMLRRGCFGPAKIS